MRMNPYPDEFVLTIRTEDFRTAGYFSGLTFDVERYKCFIEDASMQHFLERNLAEHDSSFKQLIPYAILHCGSDVFVYRRGKLQGEKRLVGNYSLGIGGHISVHDRSLFGTPYSEGLQRELTEEVDIQIPYKERLVALLNDDSNEVGTVHLGVVHVITLEQPRVLPREKAMVDPQFLSVQNLQSRISEFESWSQICIQNIEKLLSR